MIASVDTNRSSAASTEGQRNHNACLSVLSTSALSILKPHLIEATLTEGAILWDAKRPATDVYFPVSGLISIVLAMPDGECVEVGSIAREAAAGLAFDGDQSELLTRGVVQIGGKFVRINRAQLLSAAGKNREIDPIQRFARGG